MSAGGLYTNGVKFRGINQAGAEYSETFSGWDATSTYYTWPGAGGSTPNSSAFTSILTYYTNKGFNTIRLPISWERYQHTLLGSANTTYEANLIATVNQAVGAGFYVILDLHNYNRYATGSHTSDQGTTQSINGVPVQHVLGDVILTNAHLVDVWQKLGALFKNNGHVSFNLMNEPHDFSITSDNYAVMINAQITAIRGVGANNLILVPNSRASDVDHWQQYSPNDGSLDSVAMLGITDSANNFAHDMHAYWDPAGFTPARYTSYANLLSEVTAWAITNNRKLFLSEMGCDPATSGASTQIGGALAYMNSNSNVWLGWTAWNLPPYQVTLTSNVADGSQLPSFSPYLTSGTVSR
jgi:endoglucanase